MKIRIILLYWVILPTNDVEGDAFNHIECTTVPGAGDLWVDTDGDGTINGLEVIISAGNTVSVANISANLFKFKPVANENGAPYTNFTFRVNDGTDYSVLPAYTMTIDVTGINSEPTFTPGGNQTVNEDAGAQTVPAWATAINKGGVDEAGQTLTFNITNDNLALFAVQPDVDEVSGDLTYTPAVNTYGVANIDIYLEDDGGTANGGDDASPVYSFTITVNSVNDLPVLSVNALKTVLEGAANEVIPNTELEYTDVDHLPAQITYTLTSAPTNGTLYNNATPLVASNTFNARRY